MYARKNDTQPASEDTARLGAVMPKNTGAYGMNARSVTRACAALMLVGSSISASPASADGRDWFGFADTGLGFLSGFRDSKSCKDTLDELAGAATSLSPESWGAGVGLALGAAAGAATTRSVLGALRGGIVMGSIGSALGHRAEVVAPDAMGTLADDLQDALQARNGKLCELVKANAKLRAPVLHHLGTAVSRECEVDADAIEAMDPAAGAALDRCVATHESAAHTLAKHVRVLRHINRGTCHIAAALVYRFEATRAKHGHAPAPSETLVPDCGEPHAPADALPRDQAPDLGEQFL